MIDCGASHNFISTDLVERLAIPQVPTNRYGVLMGTGFTVKGECLCKGVVLKLQNIEVMEDFLPFELGSANVILGMKWLEMLGGMQVNWKTLTMRFKMGGVAVTLQGDPSLCNSLVSLKAMMKAIREEGLGVLLELVSFEVAAVGSLNPVPTPLEGLLRQHDRVFEWPTELPPRRARDHMITLQLGTALVNVCPYRYPHV